MIRAANPMDHKPVKDTARLEWHEVSKVQHYWLDVNTMTLPMQGRGEETPYGKDDQC